MQELRKLLDGLDYDTGFRQMLGDYYDSLSANSLNSVPWEDKDGEPGAETLLNDRVSNPTIKLALKLFLFARPIDWAQWRALTESRVENPRKLLDQLLQSGLMIRESKNGKETFRLNDLAIDSIQLPGNKDPMYIFSDVAKAASPTGREPSNWVAGTSKSLLRELVRQNDQLKLEDGSTIIDFGSGVLPQAIAIQRMNPDKKLNLVGVEIDKHAMNLSWANAHLNGITKDALHIVDNSATIDPLPAVMKKLPTDKKVIAVTNPPFNLVPKELEKDFPVYGYGGPDGMAVFRKFLQQGLPYAEKWIIYGEFAKGEKDKRGEPRRLATQAFKDEVDRGATKGKGLIVSYGDHDKRAFAFSEDENGVPANLEKYAANLRTFFESNPHPKRTGPLPSEAEIVASLKKAGVHEVAPTFITVEKTAEPGVVELPPFQKFKGGIGFEIRHLPLSELSGGERIQLPKGGVYKQFGVGFEKRQKGGVFIEERKVGQWEKLFQALKAGKSLTPEEMEELERMIKEKRSAETKK